MNFLAQFANVSCRLDDVDHFGFFSSWLWKVDSYRVSGDSSALHIRLRESATATADGKLLQDEITGFFHRQVLRVPDGGSVWRLVRSKNQEVYLQYHVSPDWKTITLLTDHTGTAGQMAFEYLGQVMPSALLPHSILTFHGVLMEHNGRGIIISADSGVGKTTHARLWRDYKRALIINGDRATCQKVDGVWTGFGLPWSGTSGEQINRSVPLKALVILERGEENEAHRIQGLEAFGASWPHVQYPKWDENMTAAALDLTDDFLSHVPVIRLHCRPDQEAVEVLEKALEELSHE